MSKDSKRNYHEDENAMVQNMNDLEALGKEMEQISEETVSYTHLTLPTIYSV